MERYQMKIELLSDLCVSDGGVYNSLLDTDICYDPLGFPFIPARRLKGCLRECALELKDWGKNIPIREMFGEGGSSENAAKVRIGNAYLENYQTMKAQVQNRSDAMLFHPQNILNHFSYIRTQTGIDYETGVTDEGCLRTIRVVDKGLVFKADVEIQENEKKFYEALKICCEVMRHMGISRTRGLGEIQITLVPESKENGKKSEVHVPWVKGADYLAYSIFLEEPVICKSVNGGESKTLDYIEGSKILGMIAQGIKEKKGDFLEFMEQGELICSNAYIGNEQGRYVEVPASLYSIKNNDSDYVDKLYAEPQESEGVQLNMMKHCYIRMDADRNLKIKKVKIEERYHHRRPEDKAVGRASEESDKNSQFYQMSSILAGQTFCGYIKGAEEQIQRVYECITNRESWYLGSSRSAEYGKVRILVTKVEKQSRPEETVYNEFIVKLEAPTILYSDKAFYSINVRELEAEINAVLGLPEEACKEVIPFLNYTTVGGYNVTWGKRKPVVEAFDKGTILYYRLKEPKKLCLPSMCFIGERVSEGFGEISVIPIDTTQKWRCGHISEEEKKVDIQWFDIEKGSFADELCEKLFREYVKVEAIEAAKKFASEKKMEMEKMRPVISNMLLMCAENSTIEEVCVNVESRYGKKTITKEEKLGNADLILSTVKMDCKNIPDQFEERYYIRKKEYSSYEKLYLEEFLNELKYLLRARVEKKEESKNE